MRVGRTITLRDEACVLDGARTLPRMVGGSWTDSPGVEHKATLWLWTLE